MARLRRQWGEDSTVRIDLSSGGSVTLVFKGNLFDLMGDELKLITDISAIIQKYKDTQAGSVNEISNVELQRA